MSQDSLKVRLVRKSHDSSPINATKVLSLPS